MCKQKSILILCTWKSHIHERVIDTTYMRVSEIKREKCGIYGIPR